MDLPHRTAVDLNLRWVDDLPNFVVPSYTSLDLRLAWEPTQHVELAIVGQNLLEKQHAEFGAPSTRREIQRGVYVKATCRF